MLLLVLLVQLVLSLDTPGTRRIVNDQQLALLQTIDGYLYAAGDYNSDKMTDLFLLDTSQTQLEIWLWNSSKFQFDSLASIQQDLPIINVIASDFDYDGKLDLLLINTLNQGRLYYGNYQEPKHSIDIPNFGNGQPMLLDFYGNMHSVLLGETPENQLKIWSFNSTDYTLNNATQSFCSFSDPNSNSFVDIDGDCMADIVQTCIANDKTKLQIWLNKKSSNFVLKSTLEMPRNSGRISFGDIDGDGTMDIIFPSCDGSDCFIHVWFNRQIPLCTNGASNCRPIHQLCVSDPAFTFDQFKLELPMYPGTNERIVMTENSLHGNPLVPIRIGDLNHDGYPDLLVQTKSTSNTFIRILLSTACDPSQCPSDKRTFELIPKSFVKDLDNIPGTINGAAFIDLDEDGSMDLLVTSLYGSQAKTHVVFNNLFNDAFFLKSMIVNGVCHSWCPTGDAFPQPKPYGVNYPGGTIKFTVSDVNGRQRANVASQLTQSSYRAMQLPYSLVGLGRTNNYIENLFVGTNRNQSEYFAVYQGVIPNSQLIILPYQAASESSSVWRLELYINPSRYVVWVLAVLGSLLLIVGIVIFVLHLHEKHEDEVERQRLLHGINFDAL